jgi:cytochrome c5
MRDMTREAYDVMCKKALEYNQKMPVWEDNEEFAKEAWRAAIEYVMQEMV